MSLCFILIVFGFVHSFALLVTILNYFDCETETLSESKDLQCVANENLMPRDMVKMNVADPNWKGEGIFKRNIELSGIFVHRETGEIIWETKEKLWTENEIVETFGYEPEEFSNL